MLFSSALLAALLAAGSLFDAMAQEQPDRRVCMRPVTLAAAAMPPAEQRD